MKKPTIDKMKLLVAGMIPEHILVLESGGSTLYGWNDPLHGFNGPVTEREWLHVAWLAEESLSDDECREYGQIIEIMGSKEPQDWEARGKPYAATYAFHATVEQRLEALCRIKHPGLFQ